MSNSLTVCAKLGPVFSAFIQQGVSVSVASRDRRHVPSVGRGMACRITPDGARIEVALLASQNAQLLQDITNHGVVAVAFSQPTSHKTLQIKGVDAHWCSATAQDLSYLEQQKFNFGEEIRALGFSESFIERLFHQPLLDVRWIRFTPAEVYGQTPGPCAGERLDVTP